MHRLAIKTVGLSEHHHNLLTEIAQGRGKTRATVIAEWIREAIAKGEIPDRMSGVDIQPGDDRLTTTIKMFGVIELELAADSVFKLAGALERVADGFTKEFISDTLATEVVISRQGNGILFRHGKNGVTFGTDTARDLVRHLRSCLH